MKISPENYIDEHGAITQHPKDGADEGDSAHREAFYWLGCLASDTKPVKDFVFKLFFPIDNMTLSRHAKAKKPWIRELDRGSRDQYTPWICLFTWNNLYYMNKPIFDMLKKNKMWFNNTKKNGILITPDKRPDLMSPKLLAVLLRCVWGKWSVIPNSILDIHTLLATIHWRFRDKSDNDICNHLAIIVTSREKFPTIWSRLAWHVLDKDDCIKRLKQYWDWPGFAKQGENYKDAWWVAKPWIDYLNNN